MPDRLYLDNAATSFPKPAAVLEAMRAYAEEIGASAGRGAYRETLEAGRILSDCRARLARLIGARAPEQVVFALNCSAALNQAIKGLFFSLPAPSGRHVVTTTMEHNSVLRPLESLKATHGIEVTHVPADPRIGFVRAEDVIAAIRPETRLVCMVHASNVTGAVQPVEAVGREARRRGIPFLVDAAQSAGHLPIDVEKMHADFLAVPGHKGLLGPLGTGALYIRKGLESQLLPLVEGGTGSVSERPIQPDFMPDKFESGSHNAIGIAGLTAALEWIEERTVEELWAHDRELSRKFMEQIADIPGLTVYGPLDEGERVAVFSVRVSGLEPQELSALLESEFGILTRSGIHCAPLAHETLGTHADGGTTRISFGSFSTLDDVDRCAKGLAAVAAVNSELRIANCE